jgi:NTP pyrophosphatase (non-canonical NTP hydrolase)
MKISEAQAVVRSLIKKFGVTSSVLASLAGVYEELGELSSDILSREGFKERRETKIDYRFAEVLFELFKLAEDCNVDLEEAFTKAVKEWTKTGVKPLWK